MEERSQPFDIYNTKTFGSSYAQFQCVEMYNNQIVDSWSGSPLMCGQRSGNEYVTGGTVNINQIYADCGIEESRISDLLLKFNISGNTSYTVTTNIGTDPKLVETKMSGNEVVTVDLKKIKEMGYNDFAIIFAQGSFSSLYFNTIEMTYKVGQTEPEQPEEPENEIVSRWNRSYGISEFQKLDIHYFSGKKAPVILTIHGGNWFYKENSTVHSKAYYNYMTKPITDAGCVHVNINYRLLEMQYNEFVSNINCTDMLNDIKSAIEYIKTNYSDYIDTNKMALMGWSAGAHLALLYTYTEKESPIPITLVIDEAGPTDLLPLYNKAYNSTAADKDFLMGCLQYLVGGEQLNYELSEELRKKLNEYSPYDAVKKIFSENQEYTLPYTLMVHGTEDNVVPKDTQIDPLYNAIQAKCNALNINLNCEIAQLNRIYHESNYDNTQKGYPKAFEENISGYQSRWKAVVAQVLKP